MNALNFSKKIVGNGILVHRHKLIQEEDLLFKDVYKLSKFVTSYNVTSSFQIS